jgi:DNA mismatch endonuclease (patch repair protein)
MGIRRVYRRVALSRSEQMARIRSADTSIELAVRQRLWARGLRYRVRARLPGRPDIVFSRARLAVFIDGCFWHGCDSHYRAPRTNPSYWAEKVRRNTQRDRHNDELLSMEGWRPLHVWEHEIRQNPEAVVESVVAAVESRQATPSGRAD